MIINRYPGSNKTHQYTTDEFYVKDRLSLGINMATIDFNISSDKSESKESRIYIIFDVDDLEALHN